ncbi:hypothetical protein AB0C52_17780 [Streptomyces sp. NPDC048717]|uniref:hypothetical protein n=1 Tax=unclassified Streptomyces TaxID=2593676 RepID=UPI00342D257A
MDIPDWFVWIAFGLTLLQAFALVPLARRLRGPDSARRSKARFDLLEAIGGLLIVGSLPLASVLAGPWGWLAVVGFALMATVYAMKGIRLLRARRRPMT